MLKLKRQLNDAGSALKEPSGKKRKLEETDETTQLKRDLPMATSLESIKGMAWTASLAALEVRDVSFVLPQRKKFNLAIRPGSFDEDGGITLQPPTDNLDKQLIDSLSMRWLDIGKASWSWRRSLYLTEMQSR